MLKEIEERKDGVSLKELTAKLPDLTRNQVQTLLKHLRKEGKAHPVGGTKGARWHPGPEPGIADKSRE